MKSWQAFLAQMGIAAAQVATAAPVFTGGSAGHALANTGIQIGAQFGLMALQFLVARKNSNSDPNGNALSQTVSGNYVTTGTTQLVSSSAAAGGPK